MVRLVLAAIALALVMSGELAHAETATTRVAVAFVEPDDEELGYRATLEGRRGTDVSEILRLFADHPAKDLAVVIDSRVPIEAVFTLTSLASKAEYHGARLKIFLVGHDRKGMQELGLGSEGWLPFTVDPDQISVRFSAAGN